MRIPRKLNTILLNLARSFAASMFNFIIAILGVRTFGTDNWGELVSILLTLFVFTFIAGWGNTEYLIRSYGKHPALIYQSFLSSLLTRSVFLLLTPVLFFIYPIHIALIVVPLICVQFISESMNSLVVYHHKFKAHIIAEVVLFLTVLTALLSLDSFSVSRFLTFYLIANLAKTGILIFALNPFSQRISVKFDVKIIVSMIPFFLIVFSGWMHSRIELYIIDFFRSPSELSQYQILATAFIMLQGTSAFIIYPFSKHIYRLKAKTVNKIQRNLFLISFPAALLGGTAIWLFLSLYTPVRFDMNIYILMTVASFPPFLFVLDVYKLFKNDMEKKVVKISFIGAFVKLGIALAFVPHYGVLGGVIGVVVSQWVILMLFKFNRLTYLLSIKS
jgi:O-antigen/teichoic acid export membrane protein